MLRQNVRRTSRHIFALSVCRRIPFLLTIAAMFLISVSVSRASDPRSEAEPKGNQLVRSVPERTLVDQRQQSVVQLDFLETMIISPSRIGGESSSNGTVASVASSGECGEVTYTDPQIYTTTDPIEVTIQAGFSEGEIAYVSYHVDPALFPLKLQAMECIFAHNALVPTNTEWSVIIWDGPPNGNGIQIAEFSSDDPQLATIQLEPGSRAVNVRLEIDPSDPDQIFILNDSGFGMLTIGFRVDSHNNPPADPCVDLIDPQSNAFPATDTDGVFTLADNWLYALNCGGPCDGLNTFQDLLPGFCRPSGDWLIRATFACAGPGACCRSDQTCADGADQGTCEAQNGLFMGGGSTCSEIEACPTPVGACCLDGSCLENIEEAFCSMFLEGTPMGQGSVCELDTCTSFACCLPDGSCQDVPGFECDDLGGAFQDGVACDGVTCPQPRGSCCIGEFCVPDQTRLTCEQLGTWNGLDSTCIPDPCAADPCPSGLTILDSIPASGTLDARQPHEPSAITPRQGIAASTEPVSISLGVEGLSGCFALCETVADPQLGVNSISTVTDLGGGWYEIVANRAITPGAVTTISYIGDGSFVEYTSHPGNANADSASSAADILFVIDVLNGVAIAPYGGYSVDVDHSGVVTAADLLRVIDLLNGAEQFSPWLGTSLPVNSSCP